MRNNDDQQSTLRAIMRSEITWLLFIVGSIYAFTTTVVLPLQALQINVAQIQKTLTEEQTKYKQWEVRLGNIEIDNNLIKSKLGIPAH